jgi:hypothetical protein
MVLFGTCRNSLTPAGEPVYPDAGTYSHKYGCPGLVSDCMLTCPGATVATPGPGFTTESRWAEDDYDDEGAPAVKKRPATKGLPTTLK